MEIFNEQLVKRVKKPKQLIIKILSVALLITIPALCIVLAYPLHLAYLIYMAFFIFLIGIYIVWYVFRGDIFYADLSPVIGSEQGGIRPVLIVQNDVGNRFSPTVIAAAITSQQSKANLPTHIPLNADSSGLAKDSVVLLEQVRTIDKKRLKEKMGSVDQNYMSEINDAISISFGLNV